MKTASMARISLLTLLLALFLGGNTWARCACVNSDCFEDLTITQAGIDVIRGTYHFAGIRAGKTSFENDAGAIIRYDGSDWLISHSGQAYYAHTSDLGAMPPASGWDLTPHGDIPLPLVSQPDECGGAPEIYAIQLTTEPWNGQWVALEEAITLKLWVSKLLADTPRVTVMGQSAVLAGYAARNQQYEWRFRYTPRENDPEGPVAFTVDYEDLAGRSGPQITEADAIVETFLYPPYCNDCGDQYIFDRTPPTRPVRVYPEDSAVITDSSLTILWLESLDTLSGLSSYHVDLRSEDADFVREFAVSDTTQSTFYNLAEGTYTWDIAAVDNAGNKSIDNGSGTFTIDAPDGELVLSSPQGTASLAEGAACSNVITAGLSEAPSSDVTVLLEWGDQISTEGSEPRSSLQLILTPTMWQAIPICLYAVDDDVYEGYHTATIWGQTSCADFDFDALGATAMITILDNDPLFQGVVIAPAGQSGGVTDAGIESWHAPEHCGFVHAANLVKGDPISGGVRILTAMQDPLYTTSVKATLSAVEFCGNPVEVASQTLYYDIARQGFFFRFEECWTANTEGMLEVEHCLNADSYLLTLEFEDGSTQTVFVSYNAAW